MQKNQIDQFLPKYLFCPKRPTSQEEAFLDEEFFGLETLVAWFAFFHLVTEQEHQIYFSKFALTIYKGLIEENYCNDFSNVTFLLHQQIEQNSEYFFLFCIFLFFLHLAQSEGAILSTVCGKKNFA